jgi:hypothetical protein
MIDILRTSTIFVLFLLSSCFVDQVPRNMRKSKLQYKKKKTENPTFGATGELYWYTSKNNGKIISLDRENTSIIYLRGRFIHEFLKYKTNASKKYCLVGDFTLPDESQKQLRVQTIPITFTNFSTQTLERLFRLDLKEKTNSEKICDGVLPFTKNNIVSSTQITSLNVAFQTSDLCSNCSTLLSSVNITIYEENKDDNNLPINLTSEQKISKQKLPLTSLGLEVLSPAMSSKIGDSRCSNSICQARKFDCCLNNQCVKDAQVKPGASSLSDYNQALVDVETNEMNFLLYPNIYYICPNFPRPIASKPDEGDNDNLEQAQAQLELDKNYYNCLLEGEKESPSFEDNNVCEPSIESQSRQQRFEEIRSLIWKRCGCKADPFPTEPDNLICPNYGLRPIKNLADQILRFECSVPSNAVSGPPFQDLEIKLNGRTIPHRFYKKTDGSSVDDLTTLITSVDQEGNPFFYQDDQGKSEPEMSPFSMNAILGPINVMLNQSVPAKVINVEFDRQYIISAIKGFFTPCPQCQKDSWLSSLSAYPFSQNGVGVQAAGYSTKRNSYDNNTSNGNYEDTIFGRACWIPPTMIALGHSKNSSLQTQRLNRLETQSAFFVNGYQRDWYGFNKGAIIGSFNGISWFSIGNGRRVTSTSTKLFLAFNAPFGDLSDPTTTTVSVLADLGSNSVANFDYNPSLGLEHPQQNKGGTCRLYHQCEKDSDCVTKLGWEYVCSDVSRLKSHWPKFDKDANETANDQIDQAGFSTILSNFPPGGSSTKRCVYKGAGSLCKRNYKSDLDVKYQKLLTCAPNFYCASLGDNVFNTKVIRTPNLFNPIIFGQQASILGRPENYVGASSLLTDIVKENIRDNASLFSSDTDDFGLCRPGKQLVTTTTAYPLLTQHKNADSKKRTDYISQISSCDETKTGDDRVITCPLFERNIKSINYGNYIKDVTSDNSSLISDNFKKELHYQNACGKESVYEDTSSFSLIEAKRISLLAFLEEETMAASACLRRAGSICHTSLDCVPNILHEKQALTLDKTYFGDTDAEHQYWQESLVCGQAQRAPLLTDLDYEKYDMTLNRCCREIGKELTMYTQYKKDSADPDLIPDQGSGSLDMSADTFSYNFPSTDGRYSRYGLIDLKNVDGTNDSNPTPYNQLPIVETVNNIPETPRQFQWKSLHETGRRSCCGGGWIRKFSDDTNDWTQNPRINFDIAAFSCLNYQTPLSFYPPSDDCNSGSETTSCLSPDKVSPKNYNKDVEKLCLSPANGGCLQVEIPAVSGFELTYPSDMSNDAATMDTTPTEAPVTGSPIKQALSSNVPYMPTPYANPTAIASTGPYNYFATRTFHDATSFYLPIYIGGSTNINSVKIKYVSSAKSFYKNATEDTSCSIPSNPKIDINKEEYCLETLTNNYVVFHIKADQDATDDSGNNWNYAGVQINFNPTGTTLYKYDNNNTTNPLHTRLKSGNALYYLTKLSRFELSGIPQIFYEPLYCNTDRSKLVENLYDLSDHSRNNFEASDFSFPYDQTKNYQGGRSLGRIYHNDASADLDQSSDASNPDARIVLDNKILLGQVFSPNKFKCCLKLGEESPSKDLCCSNYSISQKNTNGKTVDICKLPKGTDLNLYFNRFVSGEGYGKTLPAGGLEDTHYIPETGEPKMNQETYNKLDALGREYCENKDIRRGAAFGYFYPEPNSGFFEQEQSPDESRKYSIIDSILDSDPINDTGTVKFLQGYRWNHHVYCK